jgi:hypothetical protein
MPSFGMLHHAAVVRTDVLKECVTFIIKVTRFGELGTMLVAVSIVFLCSILQLAVIANIVPSLLTLGTLMMEVIHSSKTLVLTRTTWRNIPEDSILHMPVHI